MSAFSTLLALINAQIKTNGLKAITGAKLNGVLVQMVNELGSGYQFIDIATPATDPGTPDENVWYIASQAGTYTNFGGIIVNENEVCALVWNGSWTKKVTGAATAAQVNQLGQLMRIQVSFNEKDYAILTNGTFTSDAYYKHTAIPVIQGEVYYLISTTNVTRYAFATSDDYSAGGQIPLVSGTSVVQLPQLNTLYKITIPSGCSYLLFNVGGNYGTSCYKEENIQNIVDLINEKDASANVKIDFLLDNQLKTSGINIPFVNKSYAKIPFERVIPSGTILNNGDYSGQLYVYDTNNVQYIWTTASHYFTAPADLVSFQPTTNDAGRITTESDIYKLNNAVEKNADDIQEIKETIGEYDVSIKGAQVDFNTGQLYSMDYNGYHWAEPIPLDDGDTAIYCEDQHIERYMFYSAKPVVGENTGIYLGYTEGLYGGEIIEGAKYVVIVFINQYVPTTQPFRVYVNNPNRIAYKAYFSQKMGGKKLVTIGDSLTAQCGWQFKLSRASGMVWSFPECYFGLGYVNLNDGTYTLENKSSDPNYRRAYPSAVGGTGIKPTVADSIFMRSFDVKYYQPDIIFIYAGENDRVNTWVTPGNTGTTPDEIVANEIPYKTNAIDDSICAIAAYKGMIENLMENCPGAIIYIVSSMRVYCEIGKEVGGVIRFQDLEDVKNWENTARFPRVEYMRAIAKYYNLPLIDLWSKSGINDYNASQWYGATAYDATQVHPAKNGYLRMADVMLQCL